MHIYFLQKVSKYTCFYHAFVILIFIKSIPNQVLTIIYTHFLNCYLLFICSLFTASVHSFWGISNHTAFFFAFLKSIAMSCTKHQQMKPPSSHHQQYMLSMYKIRKLKKEIFFIYKIFVIKLSK